jgi:hypothetical protein
MSLYFSHFENWMHSSFHFQRCQDIQTAQGSWYGLVEMISFPLVRTTTQGQSVYLDIALYISNYCVYCIEDQKFLIMIIDCFCKLAIPKVYLSLLFSPVKKRNVLCSGEHKYNDISRSCYFHILKIECIRPFISKDAWRDGTYEFTSSIT